VAAQAPGRLSPVGEGAQGASGPEEVRPPRWLLFLAVSCLGISAITTQLVLMRELLNVLAGNEMIFGIILGNWFLLTGLGAMLGRTVGRLSRPIAVLVVAQVLVAVLPIVDVLAVRTLPGIVFVRGAEIGVTQAVVSCFVLLLPYCLITGYLLALACRLLASKKDAASIGQVYFLDVLGDIVGGLAFSFVLIHLLDHFSIVYIPAGLNLAFALAIAVYGGRTLLAGLVVGPAIAAVALVAALDLDALATRIEPDGGMPGKTDEERVLASILTMLRFLAEGHSLRSGTFRKHVQRLVKFLEDGKLQNDVVREIVKLARIGKPLEGDWSKRSPDPSLWKDLEKALELT